MLVAVTVHEKEAKAFQLYVVALQTSVSRLSYPN